MVSTLILHLFAVFYAAINCHTVTDAVRGSAFVRSVCLVQRKGGEVVMGSCRILKALRLSLLRAHQVLPKYHQVFLDGFKIQLDAFNLSKYVVFPKCFCSLPQASDSTILVMERNNEFISEMSLE